jgi:hypothetical protein
MSSSGREDGRAGMAPRERAGLDVKGGGDSFGFAVLFLEPKVRGRGGRGRMALWECWI